MGKCILPLGEGTYVLSCPKAYFLPAKLEGNTCYGSLPVVQANQDLTPIDEKVLFLTPFSRIIQPAAPIIPCSNHFSPKYKTLNGKWIAHTNNGILNTPEPESEINWLSSPKKMKTEKDTVNWESGLYDSTKIKQFEELLSYAGTKDSTIGKLVERIPMSKIGNNGASLMRGDVFKDYPWTSLQSYVTDKLTIIGHYSSIIIGLYSIISLTKGIFNYSIAFCKMKKFNSTITDVLKYVLNPFGFIIENTKNSNTNQTESKDRNKKCFSNILELQKLNEDSPFPKAPEFHKI